MQAVNEDICASQNFILDVDVGGFILIAAEQFGHFSTTSLNHIVESVATGLQSFRVKLDPGFVFLFLCDGPHQFNYIMVNPVPYLISQSTSSNLIKHISIIEQVF